MIDDKGGEKLEIITCFMDPMDAKGDDGFMLIPKTFIPEMFICINLWEVNVYIHEFRGSFNFIVVIIKKGENVDLVISYLLCFDDDLCFVLISLL